MISTNKRLNVPNILKLAGVLFFLTVLSFLFEPVKIAFVVSLILISVVLFVLVGIETAMEELALLKDDSRQLTEFID